MKTIIIILLHIAISPAFSQTSVIADPATGNLSFTTLNGTPIAPNQITITQPVYLRIPVKNLHTVNAVPDGSVILKAGLGSKFIIDPGFDLSNARLSDLFQWTSAFNNGQWEIYGSLYNPLDPGFNDTAVFRLKPNSMNASTITTNVLVTNHNTSILLSDDVPSNNSISLAYTVGNGTCTVSLKLFLQGYYTGGGMMQPVLLNQGKPAAIVQTDTVRVEMRETTFPFAVVSTAKGILQTNGVLTVTFNHPGGSYYLAIFHRNSLETWTSIPVNCTGSTPLYDFTSAASKAMGSNQVLLGSGVYAFYSGDINQDGFIDSNDFPAIDTDSFNGVSGVYTVTDINGDGFVDSNDFPVIDVNSFSGVTSVNP